MFKKEKKSPANFPFTGAQNNKQKTITFRITSCRRCRKEICPPSSRIVGKSILTRLSGYMHRRFNFQQNGYTAVRICRTVRICETMRLRNTVHFCRKKAYLSSKQDKYSTNIGTDRTIIERIRKMYNTGLLFYFPFLRGGWFFSSRLISVTCIFRLYTITNKRSALLLASVVDPDPDRISYSMRSRIRIQEGRNDPQK